MNTNLSGDDGIEGQFEPDNRSGLTAIRLVAAICLLCIPIIALAERRTHRPAGRWSPQRRPVIQLPLNPKAVH
jgi:hypothetical protein